jgi:predicted AAA+ superfamily ATPase
MYHRALTNNILTKFGKGKAIILVGPRQVGKTTLIRELLKEKSHLFLDGDDPTVRQLLNNPNTEQIKTILGTNKLVFIDEAQRIKGLGLTLKIITDQLKDVQLLISGSSAFDLKSEFNEPLTGRKWEYQLLPISWEEYEEKQGLIIGEQQLENRLIFGMYPDVLNNPNEERDVLKNLVDSYLYKDILALEDIRKPEVLDKLLQALAFQIGSEVNYTELSQLVGVDKNTVSKYIDILQKGYVIFKLGGFSRNLRNEIKSTRKIYFYDNGLRNLIIGNFTPFAMRADKGALWENFLISERIKQNWYKNTLAKTYFWRTKQQQEIDFIEEKEGEISAYEFKWKDRKNKKFSTTFTSNYNTKTHYIDRENFRSFVKII